MIRLRSAAAIAAVALATVSGASATPAAENDDFSSKLIGCAREEAGDARLACFDRVVADLPKQDAQRSLQPGTAESAQTATVPAPQKPDGPTVLRDGDGHVKVAGNWSVFRDSDTMT